MIETHQQAAQPVTDSAEGIIVFEQPMNERMRTFMRLDFLYNQALYQSEIATSASARGCPEGARAAPGAPERLPVAAGRGYRTAQDHHRQPGAPAG
jgi:hypothetical protein